MRSIVIHYQEIALKGKNRPWFISRLVRHVKLAMADLDVREVRSVMGRIEVVLGPARALGRLRRERLHARVRDRQLRGGAARHAETWTCCARPCCRIFEGHRPATSA